MVRTAARLSKEELTEQLLLPSEELAAPSARAEVLGTSRNVVHPYLVTKPFSKGFKGEGVFELGEQEVSEGVETLMENIGSLPVTKCLRRHQLADWGEIDNDNRYHNGLSLGEGGSLGFESAYRMEDGTVLRISTFEDCSGTLLLTDEEYHQALLSMEEKSRIAVLIPAHNEEDTLPSSLSSVLGQVRPEDVYVIDDNSSDDTVRTALEYTPNVYSTARGGKGAAMMAGIERFFLLDRYEGVLILDADSLLMPDAMSRYDEKLKKGVAAVIGRLRVLEFQKGPIAAWRRHQYFYQVAVYLRGQVTFGAGMPVTPGFCTVHSTEALRNFELDPTAPTEDIDFCWQIHRKRLGKIVYAPQAQVETGVPVNLSDYRSQIKRWHRGWHHATRKYRMPLGGQWVDLVAGLMSMEMVLIWMRFALLPLLLIANFMFNIHPTVFGYEALTIVVASFLFDAAWLMALGLISSLVLWEGKTVFLIALFPLFYLFDQFVNLYAFFTVERGRTAIWTPPVRAEEAREEEKII